MGDPTKIRTILSGNKVTVRMKMRHDMESGQRKDAAGKVIPAHYIKTVTVSHNGKSVMTADWGPAVSRDPFAEITIRGAKAGDKITVSWEDNRGDTRTDEVTVA